MVPFQKIMLISMQREFWLVYLPGHSFEGFAFSEPLMFYLATLMVLEPQSLFTIYSLVGYDFHCPGEVVTQSFI